MKRGELREAQRPLKERYRVAEGDLDFHATLGVDRDAPVGFTAIRLRFELDSDATDDELDALLETTECYCVVYQTLAGGVPLEVSRVRAGT